MLTQQKALRAATPTVTILVVLSMVLSLVLPFTNSAFATSDRPSCPLSPKAGRSIVSFPDSWGFLRSDQTSGRQTDYMNISLASGTYDVTLVSYDKSHPSGGTQPEEQWYLEGSNGGGTTFLTNATSDLPNADRTSTELVQVAMSVSQTTSRVRALHAAPKSAPTPNSITPICVAFDKAGQPPPCGICDGKVTELTLQYLGSVSGATVTVEQKKPGMTVFSGTVNPGETFSFIGKDGNGTLSTEISVYVNGVLNAEFHTSCSQPIGPGTTQGDFVVVDGASLSGGSLSCQPPKGSVTLIKHVINNDGGVASVGDFILKIDTTTVTSGVPLTVAPGSYTASEVSGDCASNGSVTVQAGEDAVCEITNDDIKQSLVCPFTPQANRTIIDFPDSWRLLSNRTSKRQTGVLNLNTPVSAGIYNISLASFDTSHPQGGTQPQEQWYLNFQDSGASTVLNSSATTDLPDSQQALAEKVDTRAVLGDDVTAVQAFHAAPKNAPTANSITPVCVALDKQPDEPTITLIKNLVNDDGGTAKVGDFTLRVDATVVESGKALPVTPGTYTASEVNLPGYDAGDWSGDCSKNGTVTVDYGDDAVCEITNNDKQRPTITLIKKVINDDGGSLSVGDFTLRIDSLNVVSGVVTSVAPNTYIVSEVQHPDYDASTWSGDCNANGSITVDYGDDAVCTITNDDKPAPPDTTITLVKTVVNNDGGSATVSDFILKVDTTTVTSGVPLIVAPGFYTASEVNLPNYVASAWGGDCAADGTITLSLGDNAVCTITNDDIPKTSITLIKHVINDDQGTAKVRDFILKIGATQVVSSVAQPVLPGSYTATEVNLAGYTASSWSGDCAADGSITVQYGDNAVCEITNDDDPVPEDPTITLIKTVINDDGGSATVSNFPLFVDQTSVTSGIPLTVSPGSYSASEIGLSNYAASNWSGDCAADGSITVQFGDKAVCEITNNDIPPKPKDPTITLIKHVINDNGKTLQVSDFALSVNTTSVTSGTALTVSPGTYVASEVQHVDYTASNWSGACASDGTVTVNFGDNVVCEITNNDKGGGGGSPQPRLTIIKTVDPTFTNPDSTVAYTITVTNEGVGQAIDVTLKDFLPDQYFSYTDGTAGLIKTWDFGNMVKGASKTVTFDADVSAAAIEGFYTNTATTQAKNHGPVSDTAVVEVGTEELFPELQIIKTVSPPFTTAGGLATYTITVKNVGQAIAKNVVVTDVMPAQLTEVVTGLTALNWNIGDLIVNQEWTVTFDVQVADDAGIAIYRNIATADADNADPVQDPADLEIREGEVLGIEELPETGAFDGAAGALATTSLMTLLTFGAAAGFTIRRRNMTAEQELKMLTRKLQ